MSLTKEDGDYECECPTGYRGKNCEKAPKTPAVLRIKKKDKNTSTTRTTTTTTTTTEEPVRDNAGEVEAMQEPENALKTRGGESVELEDIDNEAF